MVAMDLRVTVKLRHDLMNRAPGYCWVVDSSSCVSELFGQWMRFDRGRTAQSYPDRRIRDPHLGICYRLALTHRTSTHQPSP